MVGAGKQTSSLCKGCRIRVCMSRNKISKPCEKKSEAITYVQAGRRVDLECSQESNS